MSKYPGAIKNMQNKIGFVAVICICNSRSYKVIPLAYEYNRICNFIKIRALFIIHLYNKYRLMYFLFQLNLCIYIYLYKRNNFLK
jgi:hypothetical protein